MISWKTTLTIATVAIACSAGRMAAAQEISLASKEPNYRCEAAMMRADAREVSCQGRCQSLSDAPGEERSVSPRAQCMGTCHDRCEKTKERLASSPPCAPIPPDPDRCGAKLLAALSQLKFCLSNCPADPASTATDCTDRCDRSYTESRQRIEAMDVCKAGGFPVCAYN